MGIVSSKNRLIRTTFFRFQIPSENCLTINQTISVQDKVYYLQDFPLQTIMLNNNNNKSTLRTAYACMLRVKKRFFTILYNFAHCFMPMKQDKKYDLKSPLFFPLYNIFLAKNVREIETVRIFSVAELNYEGTFLLSNIFRCC